MIRGSRASASSMRNPDTQRGTPEGVPLRFLPEGSVYFLAFLRNRRWLSNWIVPSMKVNH